MTDRPAREEIQLQNSWAPSSRRLPHFTVLTNVLPVVSSDSIIARCPRASAMTRTMRVR